MAYNDDPTTNEPFGVAGARKSDPTTLTAFNFQDCTGVWTEFGYDVYGDPGGNLIQLYHENGKLVIDMVENSDLGGFQGDAAQKTTRLWTQGGPEDPTTNNVRHIIRPESAPKNWPQSLDWPLGEGFPFPEPAAQDEVDADIAKLEEWGAGPENPVITALQGWTPTPSPDAP